MKQKCYLSIVEGMSGSCGVSHYRYFIAGLFHHPQPLDSSSTISSTGSEDHPGQIPRTRPRTPFGELALRPDLGDQVPMVYLPVENGRLQIIISVF